jgi:MAF protein
VQLTRLVLASASPRRQTLVALLGLPWRTAPADLDESAFLVAEPQLSALSVALAKARATPSSAAEVVIGADTLVVADGQILGKPADAVAARSMLRQLRARPHDVVSGLQLHDSTGRTWGAVVSTRVEMRPYEDAEIEAYLARGEPFDKAGGYAVQDQQFRPVARQVGCYLNVVGLPLCAVAAGLTALGVPNIEAASGPPCSYCTRGAPLVEIRSGC